MSNVTAWYNFDKLFSFGAYFMYVLGERGLGKTFGSVKRSINRAIKHGEEFIVVRRTKEELKILVKTFFNEFERLDTFPDYDFRIVSYVAEYSPVSQRDTSKREWHTLCHFVPLSSAQNYKGSSFSKVALIIFDEFIKEKNFSHYLPNEYDAFMGFYGTVVRHRPDVKVLFLGNSVSVMNPYFTNMNLDVATMGEFTRYGKVYDNGRPMYFAIIHLTDSKEFKEQVSKSLFAQFVAGTSYGDFANDNKFKDGHDELVKFKPPEARYSYTLETKHGTFAVWYDASSNEHYIQAKRPKGEEIIFTMIAENMTEEKTLVTYTDRKLQRLRTSWRHGRAFMDKPSTRNAFSEVFVR